MHVLFYYRNYFNSIKYSPLIRPSTCIASYFTLAKLIVPHSTDSQSLARYSVLCKVYTGYCGTSETEHSLCACTVDNPRAKARGLSLRTGAQTMLSLSLLGQVRTFSQYIIGQPISSNNQESTRLRLFYYLYHTNVILFMTILRSLGEWIHFHGQQLCCFLCCIP